jgi:enoyl reductase-like protein
VACDPKTKETLDFLSTVVDIIDELGPDGVEELCFKSGSMCQIADLKGAIAKAREFLAKGCQ